MRLVAIRADHAGALHPALREAAPFEDLALDLAIRMVFAARQKQRRMGVQEALPGQRIGGARQAEGIDAKRAIEEGTRLGLAL